MAPRQVKLDKVRYRMNLPTNENPSKDLNDLPLARQRHLRRKPHQASVAERQILIESLVKLTSPTPSFFMRAFLGALAVGGALYFNNLALLIIAIVGFPFNTPLFGLALFPVTNKERRAGQSLISLLILISLSFIAGILAGWLQKAPFADGLHLYHFSSLYWLHLLMLVASVCLGVLVLIRQGELPIGLGALMSYTQLVPFAIIGFGLTRGQFRLWTGAALISFAHLFLALLVAILIFLILGFSPKTRLGWIVGVVVFMLSFAFISLSVYSTQRTAQGSPTLPPAATQIAISLDSATPIVDESMLTSNATPKPTHEPTPTVSPTIAHTKTFTPTVQPTVFWGEINSDIGAFIRQNPSRDAIVVTTVNHGDLVEVFDNTSSSDGTLWYHVRLKTGDEGWLLGSLLITPTPSGNS